MADLGISYIMKFIYSILTIILLVFIYTYLTNLENKGCACALTPNNAFIKGFTLFAIIYLIFTGFVSDKMLHDSLGSNIVLLYKYVDLIFVLVFIYYLYQVFQYTRYLVNEKCKCSVDIRREIIMIGSLIEFGLIFLLFLLHIIAFTIFTVIYSVVSQVNEGSDNVRNVIRDPIGSLSKVPKSIKNEMSNINNYISKTSSEIKKIGSKRRTK
jgi:hypothetical protein